MYILLLGLALILALAGQPGEAQPAPEAEGFPFAQYGLAPSTNPACIPAPRTDWAAAYRVNMLKREPVAQARVLFLGDSITMMWRSQSGYEGGTPVWEQHYAPLPAANLGISGDRTEHLLWRVTAGGDLEEANPQVVVLLIGINNLLQRKDSPAQVAEGIKTLAGFLKTRLPQSRVLLLGVFPCWERPENPARGWVREVNALIEPLADRQRVWYLDLGPRFLEPDGTISKVKLRDLLHLSEKGYEIWAEAMAPYLQDLLEGNGQDAIWEAAKPAPQP
jgi:lysophospholipase L1-like esterase